MEMLHYVLLYKKLDGKGQSISFRNLRRLEAFAGKDVNFHTLERHFSRERKTWWEDPYRDIIIIRVPRIEKGLHRVHRKDGGNGKGNLLRRSFNNL